ncbi:MAG: ChaN family lipoprotein [Minwuia sp.]|nr:ChaN family lipoprotein [Minwuia sp.]
MRHLLMTAIAATLAVMSPAMAQAADRLIPDTWTTSLQADHPLVGRIWVHSRDALGTERDLRFLVSKADHVLLGEKHNNPDHHLLQARLLRWATEGKRGEAMQPRTVVWEMITTEQQDALQSYLARPGATAAGMGNAVNWDETGWPAWSEYQPIADVAMELGLPQIAGNISARNLMASATGGDSKAVPASVTYLMETARWTDADREALKQELVDSHCGMLDGKDKALAGIARVQRLRDAALALGMAASTDGAGAVLIAGSGHVRKDRGVPRYLAALAPRARMAAIAMFEVVAGEEDPRDYIVGFEPGAFDAIIFTPRLDDKDPCARFRKTPDDKG